MLNTMGQAGFRPQTRGTTERATIAVAKPNATNAAETDGEVFRCAVIVSLFNFVKFVGPLRA
jgi:hypothetical protein